MTTATIIGVDLSLTATGMCASGGPSTISPPKGMTGMERLNWLQAVIRGCILSPEETEEEHRQTLVVFEGLSYGSNDPSAQERAGLAYLLRHALYTRGVPYLLVPPTTLKKFVTGKGNAEKSLMLLEVYKRFGVSAANDNEADAVGLYYIGMAYAGQREPTTDAQREVLATLRGETPKKAKKAKKRAALAQADTGAEGGEC